MPEQNHSDPAKTAALAGQIVKILASADSDTRRRATQAAMTLLGESPITVAKDQRGEQNELSDDSGLTDLAAFFQREEKLKPSDHAYLCAAYHYSVYGAAPFSLDDLRKIAGEAGVVLPDRLDMTLKQAGKSGKKLFLPSGRDAYRPTAPAGILFKEKWGVKPGKQSKPSKAAD
jgi:hypothetical protein